MDVSRNSHLSRCELLCAPALPIDRTEVVSWGVLRPGLPHGGDLAEVVGTAFRSLPSTLAAQFLLRLVGNVHASTLTASSLQINSDPHRFSALPRSACAAVLSVSY